MGKKEILPNYYSHQIHEVKGRDELHLEGEDEGK